MVQMGGGGAAPTVNLCYAYTTQPHSIHSWIQFHRLLVRIKQRTPKKSTQYKIMQFAYVLGAFLTSLTTSLHVESGVMPSKERRELLCVEYYAKVASNPSHRNCCKTLHSPLPLETKYRTYSPIGHMMQSTITASHFYFLNLKTSLKWIRENDVKFSSKKLELEETK